MAEINQDLADASSKALKGQASKGKSDGASSIKGPLKDVFDENIEEETPFDDSESQGQERQQVLHAARGKESRAGMPRTEATTAKARADSGLQSARGQRRHA